MRIVLALALDAQGRGDEALAALRELPADVPLDAGIALRLAAADAEAGEIDTALRRLALAVERHPRDPKLARSQGLLLVQAGRHEEALAAFEAALALEPDLAVLQNDVAWALARVRRDLDRALALATRAAAASENDPSVLDTLALVRLARGDAAEALEAADRALRRADAGAATASAVPARGGALRARPARGSAQGARRGAGVRAGRRRRLARERRGARRSAGSGLDGMTFHRSGISFHSSAEGAGRRTRDGSRSPCKINEYEFAAGLEIWHFSCTRLWVRPAVRERVRLGFKGAVPGSALGAARGNQPCEGY